MKLKKRIRSKIINMKILASFLSLAILAACNPAIVKYQLDPGIDGLADLPKKIKIVAISVTDARTNRAIKNNDPNHISGPENEAKTLQQKLSALLKQKGYKIISKPLLADVAFNIQILALGLELEPSTFKTVIQGKSDLKLTVNKQSRQWAKISRVTRQQEIANPVNSSDVTGVMNQMLTTQFSDIFADTALKKFIQKEEY